MVPNSTIKLCRSVPIDNTYRNTIYTTSKAEQFQYFDTGYVYLEFTANTYVRVENNVIRVQVNLAQNPTVYNCNYLLFRNTAYENKWFYAFVTEVLYVNDNAVQIRYELDVIQTWFHDITFRHCMIRRQHAWRDSIGSNIEPEPVDLGEYVFASQTDGTRYKPLNSNDFQNLSIIVLTVDAQDMDDSTMRAGSLVNGIYSGAVFRAFPATEAGVQGLNAFVTTLIQKPDAIISMYMCPTELITQDGGVSNDGTIITDSPTYFVSRSSAQLNDEMGLDGYFPKNNKMYTYPYNFFHVYNSLGSCLTLRYEYFEQNMPVFGYWGTIIQPVEITLKPLNYKNVHANSSDNNNIPYNNNEVLTVSSYAMCSWATDAWRAWVAQNTFPIAVKALAAGGMGFIAGGPVGAVAGAAGALLTDVAPMYKASIQADQIHGNFSCGNVNTANRHNNFYGGRMCVPGENAEDIDNFFTKFGYAQNKVATPRIHARTTYTYIKTENCLVTGNAPADAIGKIEKIMDNGITWWVAGSTVGDYFVTNMPLGDID